MYISLWLCPLWNSYEAQAKCQEQERDRLPRRLSGPVPPFPKRYFLYINNNIAVMLGTADRTAHPGGHIRSIRGYPRNVHDPSTKPNCIARQAPIQCLATTNIISQCTAIVTVFSGMAILTSAFRLSYRLRIRRFWWDDAWVALSMCCELVLLIAFWIRTDIPGIQYEIH